MSSSVLTNFDTLSSEQLLSLTLISETSERYNDMRQFMKCLVLSRSKSSQELSIQERNLLSVAYKNTVSKIRSSLRMIIDNNDNNKNNNNNLDSIKEENENEDDDNNNNNIIDKYKLLLENKVKELCLEILTLLIDHLLTNENDQNDKETKIFYLKMCGDYYRYLSELVIDKNNKTEKELKYAENAEKYYNQSMIIAKNELSPTHPTRLGLSLNFSVCLYEILSKKNEAMIIAKEAFDLAMNKLDTLKDDETYNSTTSLMELLRDNLQYWSTTD